MPIPALDSIELKLRITLNSPPYNPRRFEITSIYFQNAPAFWNWIASGLNSGVSMNCRKRFAKRLRRPHQNGSVTWIPGPASCLQVVFLAVSHKKVSSTSGFPCLNRALRIKTSVGGSFLLCLRTFSSQIHQIPGLRRTSRAGRGSTCQPLGR